MGLDDLRRDLEAEPLTGVDALRADLLGPSPAAPAADEAMGIPTLSDAIAGFPSALNSGLKAAREWMQPAANNLVNFAGDLASDFIHPLSPKVIGATGPRGLFTGPSDETRAPPTSSVGRLAAEMVNQVPGNLTEAGGLLGTVALGPYGILSRILGGAGGAGIGQALSGGDAEAVAKAAALGGAANVVGEGVAGGLALGAKSLPGAATRIRNQDAARMIEAASEISPGLGRVPLEGRTASEALQTMGTKGKQGLNDAKEEAIQRIEAALQEPRPGVGVGAVPETQGPFGLAPVPERPSDILRERYLSDANMPGAPVPEGAPPSGRSLVGPRGVMLEIPSMGRPVTLREANAELTAIGDGLRHVDILDPRMRQKEAGRAYATLSEEIRQALDAHNPELGAAFQRAQQDYAAGLDFIKQIARETNWKPGNQGIEFDARRLQGDLAKNAIRAGGIERKMGEEGSATFFDALTRGEGLGRVDRIPAGGGGPADALMAWLRGNNSGSMGLPQAVIRSFLPNVGAQYIGRKPYTLDPGIKALMDILTQRTSTAVMDKEIAEAEAARRTAGNDPRLQLEVRPR